MRTSIYDPIPAGWDNVERLAGQFCETYLKPKKLKTYIEFVFLMKRNTLAAKLKGFGKESAIIAQNFIFRMKIWVVI